MLWMRWRVSSDALTNLNLELLPLCSVLYSSRTEGESINVVKRKHWFPRRKPPWQDKEQWMMMRSVTSKIAHKIPIHGGLHTTKLNLMLSNKNIINARMMGVMFKGRCILLFTMQRNQVLCFHQLLKKISIGVSVQGCTGIMAIDVWRIELEGGIKITHKDHLILLRNMIQSLLQAGPNLGTIIKKLFLAFGYIPGMLIYNDEVICAVQKEADLKKSAIKMKGRCNLFRSGQGAPDEHKYSSMLRR